MDDIKKEKVKRFMSDVVMQNAVKEVLRDTYLKPIKDRDVMNLAASRIAVELLDEAWKELLKYKDVDNELKGKTNNIAL